MTHNLSQLLVLTLNPLLLYCSGSFQAGRNRSSNWAQSCHPCDVWFVPAPQSKELYPRHSPTFLCRNLKISPSALWIPYDRPRRVSWNERETVELFPCVGCPRGNSTSFSEGWEVLVPEPRSTRRRRSLFIFIMMSREEDISKLPILLKNNHLEMALEYYSHKISHK